jgi:hypothetical protein
VSFRYTSRTRGLQSASARLLVDGQRYDLLGGTGSGTQREKPLSGGEQNAFLGTLFFDTTEENAGLLEDSLATDQFGWRRACAGGERIFNGVHDEFREFL